MDEDPDAVAIVAARRAGLGEAVEVEPWCRWVWRAWHDLADDRHWRPGGLGPATPCRIPWTVVTAYADRNAVDADLLRTLLHHMDELYLAWWAETSRQSAAQTGGEAGEGA